MEGDAFTGGEVKAQITAAEDIGAGGWMLWNSHNRYSPAGVTPDDEPRSRNARHAEFVQGEFRQVELAVLRSRLGPAFGFAGNAK